MKKVGIGFLILVLSVIVFYLTFGNSKTIQPNSYYQVYLDNKLMGTVKSKKELEDYIDSKGKVIKKQVNEYSSKIEIIEEAKKVINSINNDETKGLSEEEKTKYIIKNKNSLNISNIKVNTLKEYLNKKLYNVSNEEILKMKEYISNNEVYKNIKTVYAPNGIEIQKIKTYSDEIISVEEMYDKITNKKSPTVKGYKFSIKKEDKKPVEIYVTDPNIFLNAVDNMASIFVGKEAYQNYKNN